MDHDHRPGYAHGATMPLAHARWIRTHIVDAVGCMGGDLVLHAAGSTLTLNSAWGVELRKPAGQGFGIVRLEGPIERTIDAIIEWEAKHPDEPRIGSRRAA